MKQSIQTIQTRTEHVVKNAKIMDIIQAYGTDITETLGKRPSAYYVDQLYNQLFVGKVKVK